MVNGHGDWLAGEIDEDAMEPDKTIYVDTLTVACDGGGGALGHPKVYLRFDESDEIVCPYCSRKFHLNEGAREAAGHGH